MDAFVTMMIALMPLFAVAPLAIGAVIAVALVVSPRARDAFAEWTRRRLRLDAPPSPTPDARAVEALHAEVRRLEERVGFLERVMTLQPRAATPPALAAARRPSTPVPPA
ncbi:MAG: hypothetical protein AVDCRST_MAG11-3445 [uncultured Gemmatimonadaceae bacterium]|uniref:Uncharacterized protein n=1 Tax=uncultured Gemmatimonadaceae bacterium TaxID=246130 RepID=A0A6J4M9L3_9BACT|nr:MAG: hypothetical protein AVDCRST_MAG11-3445 [uncultured Gemmatimonadaceae bacterium]